MFRVFAFLALYAPLAFAGQEASPRLFFEQVPVFDMECAARTKVPLKQSWREELTRRLPEFQAAWDAKSTKLTSFAEELSGRKWVRKEYSVALNICSWTPMASPLIVTVVPYLHSEPPHPLFPLSMSAFVSMTHHELLHSLVSNIEETYDFAESSKMLSKYQNEPFNVLVHLHLIALQKAVYEKMGDRELLEQTDVLYKFIGRDYLRAWNIVAMEGADVFVQELHSFNSRKP